MLFNKKTLKKLMNDAWKSWGILVAVSEEGILHIEGMHWVVEMAMEVVPNETIGDIISLIRKLPEPGKFVKESKAGIDPADLENVTVMWIDRQEVCEADFIEISEILVTSSQGEARRLLQNPDTGEITTVNDIWAGIIDFKELNMDEGETWPENPKYKGIKFFWENTQCTLQAYLKKDQFTDNLIGMLKGEKIIWEYDPNKDAME